MKSISHEEVLAFCFVLFFLKKKIFHCFVLFFALEFFLPSFSLSLCLTIYMHTHTYNHGYLFIYFFFLFVVDEILQREYLEGLVVHLFCFFMYVCD